MEQLHSAALSQGQQPSQTVSWTEQLQLGDLKIKNRVILSSMTRLRCDPSDGIPTNLLVQYYGQRAGAGICFTEGSAWSQRGVGFAGSGNIFNKQQALGWQKVTEEVHKKGGLLFLQIYHAGRATAPEINGGHQAWAPSPIAVRGEKSQVLQGADYPLPKEMTLEDIQTVKEEFQRSIKLAKNANFDGLELQSANGFLIDTFLRSYANRRTDSYGGSVQNRCRFALELVDIASKYFNPSRIGLKLSPLGRYNDNSDQNPVETYSHLLQELSKRSVGFISLLDPYEGEQGTNCLQLHTPAKQQIQDVCKTLRPFFKGLIFANIGLNPEKGLQKLHSKTCDAIVFARLYITNPDLAERLATGAPLNTKFDYGTFYGLGLPDKAKGYTDYTFYKAE